MALVVYILSFAKNNKISEKVAIIEYSVKVNLVICSVNKDSIDMYSTIPIQVNQNSCLYSDKNLKTFIKHNTYENTETLKQFSTI